MLLILIDCRVSKEAGKGILQDSQLFTSLQCKTRNTCKNIKILFVLSEESDEPKVLKTNSAKSEYP